MGPQPIREYVATLMSYFAKLPLKRQRDYLTAAAGGKVFTAVEVLIRLRWLQLGS